jgi:hypothetical protein
MILFLFCMAGQPRVDFQRRVNVNADGQNQRLNGKKFYDRLLKEPLCKVIIATYIANVIK